MAKQVRWSPLAEKDVNLIADYLIKNWDYKIYDNFITDLDQSINQIVSKPKLFPVIHKKLNVRKLVITKHNTLFYREIKKSIEIIRVFDSRQDPKKLTFR